jgi:hypothetical protein
MTSFAEFETCFLGALQQERSELQGLQGESEAQLSAWVEHLFRDYLGYTHFKEITREGSAPIGSKRSKQLFPDLRVNVLDNGLIFVECKRAGRLDGPKGQDELNDAVSQLRSYIRAHVDQAPTKPKTVLGVVGLARLSSAAQNRFRMPYRSALSEGPDVGSSSSSSEAVGACPVDSASNLLRTTPPCARRTDVRLLFDAELDRASRA